MTQELDETRRTLTGLARGCFGKIDPQQIADHVIAMTPEGDWSIRRAALAALARRFSFGRRDQLEVVDRPARGQALGIYRTARAGGTREAAAGKRGPKSEARPYATALMSLQPIATSCSCRDFVRSSLGLCKHGLVVLADLAQAPRPCGKPPTFEVTWSPLHPLHGPWDRLSRLRMRDAAPDVADPKRRASFIEKLERDSSAMSAEPAVATLLAEERSRSERAIGALTAAQTKKALRGLRRTLYPYQEEGVERFLAEGRLLLADDMGLGKTTQAIAGLHALFASKRIERALLIAPAALKPQWKREWESTTDVPLTLVEGSARERAKIYASTKHGALAIGYEQLVRDLREVQKYAAEAVVLDEAQRIKNWATKSAVYVKTLEARYRLVLTGTPMENRLDELASLVDFVDDVALEPKWRLAPLHTFTVGDGANGIGGARHLGTLRKRLAPIMVRRVRDAVIAQLPPRTDTRVPVELTDAQKAQHDELSPAIASLSARARKRPLTQAEFLRLMSLLTTQRMLCNGLGQTEFDSHWPRIEDSAPSEEILRSLSTPKLGALRALIEEIVLGQGRKVVVFSQWRKMLRLAEWSVRDLLAQQCKRALFFTGAESSALREQAIVDLHDDPSVAVLFLSDAGGVGLNLQRAATCCIHLELPWNPAVLEQRTGRIYRLGQTHPIDVYHLVSEDGIESRIASLVGNKKAVFKTLFDGTSDEVMFEGQTSFLESVRELVDEVPIAPGDDNEESEIAIEAAPSDEIAPVPSPAPTPARSPLTITRLPDGSLRIEASPEIAEPLAELLEGVARSLRVQPKKVDASDSLPS